MDPRKALPPVKLFSGDSHETLAAPLLCSDCDAHTLSVQYCARWSAVDRNRVSRQSVRPYVTRCISHCEDISLRPDNREVGDRHRRWCREWIAAEHDARHSIMIAAGYVRRS